jgi:ribosomal protein S1
VRARACACACAQGQVQAVKEFGVLIQITSRIRALAPMLHLADGPVKDAAAKFKIGAC